MGDPPGFEGAVFKSDTSAGPGQSRAGRPRRNPSGARHGLAARAEERRPVHELDPADRRAAAVAGLALAAVGVQRPVEVARLAVDVDVEGVEARPALRQSRAPSRPAPRRAPGGPGSGGAGRPGARRAAGPATAPRRRRCCRRRRQGLVEQQPLDAGGTTAHPRRRTGRRRTRGRTGRGRCGRSRAAARRRPRRPTARRTSAGRRSAAERARRRVSRRPQSALFDQRREVEPDPEVALVGRLRLLHEELAAHPEVAEQRVAVVEREPEVLAAAAGASNRRPVSAAAKPAGPRWSRRTGRGWRTATDSMVRPTTWRSRPSRTVSTSGSSGTRQSDRGRSACDAEGHRELAVRRLRGGLLGLLLGAADAVAVAVVADADLRGEGLHVVGALVLDEVLGDAETVLGGELLERGLPVEPGTHRGGRLDQRVEEQVDDLGGALEPAGEVDRADHGLDGVGEDRGLLAAAGGVLAATELDVGRRARSCGRPRPARGR